MLTALGKPRWRQRAHGEESGPYALLLGLDSGTTNTPSQSYSVLSPPRGHLCQPVSPGIHTHTSHPPPPQPGSQMSFLMGLTSAKAPLRAFNLQTVFVHLTHHSCSTSEDVIAPTPHTPFARCHQGQCLRGDLPAAPPRSCCGSWGAAGQGSGAMVRGPGLRIPFCWWPWARVLQFPAGESGAVVRATGGCVGKVPGTGQVLHGSQDTGRS